MVKIRYLMLLLSEGLYRIRFIVAKSLMEEDGQKRFMVQEMSIGRLRKTISGLETLLVNVMSRETVLRTYIEQQKDRYDYILISIE